MAIDQYQRLQMLLQGGEGEPAISPTSGLRDPSLSGLALGPQGMGMGFGGGESLMGGGAAGLGGAGGGLGGLDLSQLLAQLQAAPGVTQAGIGTPIGFGNLGGMFEGESGGIAPTPSQQGQAGLGGAGTAAQFLRLLKEGVGLGKSLTQLFPKGATSSQVSDINSLLAELGIQGTPFVPTASAVSGASGGSVPSALFDPSQTIPFQIDPNIVSGLSGGGLFARGSPLTGAELSARLGAQGLGDIPATGVTGGLLDSLGGLPGVLGGAGVLSNLGFGALNLAQGNLGPGIGGLAGTGAGLGLGALLAPETFGLSLLLGGLGGGVGGLFGGLFGGSGPSKNWLSFAPRLRSTLGGALGAGTDLVQNIIATRSERELATAISNAKRAVESAGVGGFFGRAPGSFDWPNLPGATGTSHEGGLRFNPDTLNDLIRMVINQKREILAGRAPADAVATWPQRRLEDLRLVMQKGQEG